MKTIRLMPVVIAATAALLALKSIGLMSGGGYLLGGVSGVAAAGGAPASHEQKAAPALADGAPSIELPGHPTIADSAPVLNDHAPTLKGAEGPADHPVPAPMTLDGAGTRVPLVTDANPPADAALLTRLAERREALDARESELAMRASLVEAAEKRIEERMAELQALERQVAALVDQKDGDEASQLKALVTMYETMKPRDAAAILGALDIGVLMPIAKAIAPRRMAPILAAMAPARAQELTARMAAGDAAEGASPAQAPALRSLPQIIGQ